MTEPDAKIRGLLDRLAAEARLDPRLERSTLRRARRRRVVGTLATVAVTVGVVTGGVVAARELVPRSVPAGDVVPSPSQPAPTPTAAPTPEPSPTTEPSPTAEPPAPAVFDTDLEDGRHVAYLKKVVETTDPASVRFDLAIWLSGDEANKYAASRGLETPVPNDYLVVNDNPRLRLMPLAPDVRIRVIDYPKCCEATEVLDVETLAGLLPLREPLADGSHSGRFGLYWLTIRNGAIVGIEEQYTP